MSALALLPLLLLQSAQGALPELPEAVNAQAGERTGRPAAPYSLPPISSLSRGEPAPALVPPGTPGVVEQKATGLDDSVPLPKPPIYRQTPEGDVLEQAASGDPFFLGFAGGLHYPLAGELVDPALYAAAQTVYADGRPMAETYAFVMFSARMTEPRLAQLEALGCRLLGFHPHYTQKVALPAAAIDAVAALPFVHWVGVPPPAQKVHPALMSQLDAAAPNQPLDLWISVFESDVGPSSVRRTVPGPFAMDPSGAPVAGEPVELQSVWITNGWQHQALEAAGLEVIDFAERVSSFRVRGMPQGLELVTALDFVQFVELDLPARPMHDESTALVNADDSRSFYTGGTNSRTIAGIVDSGVETAHYDLNHIYGVGWDLSGSPGSSFDDACGHGSHVAGTILGNGDSNDDHTGVAPGLGFDAEHRFFNVRVFATCAGQPVDEASVLALTSSPATVGLETTERPHVINNSWGTDGNSAAPWVGTETECRLYDDNAFSDAQLNVFAASNDGSAYGTVGLQPTAKNVLTVGNVVDYDSPTVGLPGNLWSSSSRGPTGDGRWKPNVVAPGRQVTSVDAATTTGYTEKSGTSMAAPHVTGIAAQMIDYSPGFAYLPERLAAHLMATAHTKDHVLLTNELATHLDEFGTGRVDATRAIWGSGGTDASWSFSLGAGGSTFGDFIIPSGATRLVAVMHYIEPSASSGASSALVNDWDFYLDRPPVDPAGNTGEYFAQQSAANNTEVRIISNPLAGTWRWKVWPDSTTTTAYFGVSVYVQTGDASPSMSPSLVRSATYIKPLETVDMDYSLSTSGGSISGVFLDSNASGTLLSSSTTLKDGVVTDLLDNQHSGWDLVLGNIDPLYSRTAKWQLSWPTEGLKTFSVSSYSDNASNNGLVNASNVVVDGTPPGLVSSLMSPSHNPGVWSNDPTIDLTWSPAIDPISGGTASNLDGYGIYMSLGSPGSPSMTKDLGAVTSYTNPALASSTSSYYFNIRAVDRSGNWGSSHNVGGYRIDTTLPTTPTGLHSTTHTVGVLSCDTYVVGAWLPASDGHSGLAGYGASANSSPTGPAPTTPNIFGTTVGFGGGAGTWYLHIRSIDGAGNYSPTVHLGPFYLNPNPVTTYCTAKKNSAGCIPTIGTLDDPSYSGGAFEVTAKNVLNNKSGLLFWGYTPSAVPFQGGIKCVLNPVKRTPIQNSGGNPPPNDCSGYYSFNFSTAYMAFKGVTPGDTLYAQYWSRDPAAPFTTGLTDAVRFTVCQ